MRTSVDVSKHIDEMSSRLDAGHYLSVGYRNVGCPLSATASESIQAIESFPEHTQLSEVVRGIDILPRFSRVYVDEQKGAPFLSGTDITRTYSL